MQNIPVFRPLIEREEITAATQALEMGWLGMGSYVGEFETAIQKFLDTSDRYVAAVSTGHAALHLGFLLAGVGEGDEVITPSFNNIADFQAIIATGAEPVFCDIDDRTLCIDLDKAEQLITPRTKAIVVMDYDCLLCDHSRIAALASKYNIRVIHDAAHSFGSKYKNQKIGSFSDICMFSFDPVKTMTCIDGGALIVSSQEELQVLHEMRLIGMGQPSSVMYQNQRAWTYDVGRLGFRYHMANLHAAVGLSQLSKMPLISQNRISYARRYNQSLSNISQVRVPETDFTDITPFLYYIRVPKVDRDDLRSHLSTLGIDTGIHWQPGHKFTLFQRYRTGDLSITEQVAQEILSLPLHSYMSEETLDRIIEGVSSYFSINK
jgi:dTDP-4-amino-4,6-dideoxygalactose transaminase